MIKRFVDLMPAFGMNDWLFNSAIDGVKEEDAAYKLSDGTNTFRGIAAHLVIARQNLGKMTDMGLDPLPLSWNELGEMFEAGFVESTNFPTLKQIVTEWRRIAPNFMQRLPTVSD